MPEAKEIFKKVATYTPLSRGRLRWNQGSGGSAILKKGARKNHRRTRINEHLRHLFSATARSRAEAVVPKRIPSPHWELSRPVETSGPLLRATIDRMGDVRCPRCRNWNFGDRKKIEAGRMTCRNCGRDFFAEKEDAVPTSRIDIEGDARCPHCREYKYGVDPGMQQCRHCQNLFRADY